MVKEESEKASLKLNIQKTNIMASSPISSWQTEVGKVEAVIDFIFSRIIVDGDCSHKIKTLAPWKEIYEKPRQCVKKQKHHFVNKGSYNIAWFFQ